MNFSLPANRRFWVEFISRSSDSPWQLYLAPFPASPALAEEPAPSPRTHQPPQDSHSFCFPKATSLPAQPFQLPPGFLAWHCRDNMFKTITYKSFECFGEPFGFLQDRRTRDVQLKAGKCLYVEFGLEMGHQCSLPTKGIGNRVWGVSHHPMALTELASLHKCTKPWTVQTLINTISVTCALLCMLRYALPSSPKSLLSQAFCKSAIYQTTTRIQTWLKCQSFILW